MCSHGHLKGKCLLYVWPHTHTHSYTSTCLSFHYLLWCSCGHCQHHSALIILYAEVFLYGRMRTVTAPKPVSKKKCQQCNCLDFRVNPFAASSLKLKASHAHHDVQYELHCTLPAPLLFLIFFIEHKTDTVAVLIVFKWICCINRLNCFCFRWIWCKSCYDVIFVDGLLYYLTNKQMTARQPP